MPKTFTPAGLPRRLGALFYDSLLLFGVLFFATLILLVLRRGTALTPGESAVLLISGDGRLSVLRLVLDPRRSNARDARLAHPRAATRRHSPDLGIALRRYLLAWLALLPLGAGYFWMLIDREGLTWHDRGSRTVVVCTIVESVGVRRLLPNPNNA